MYSQDLKKRLAVLTAIVCMTVIGAGCGLSPQAKKQLAEAEMTARARAESWEAGKKLLTAKNPADAEAAEDFKNSHSIGLAAQAQALKDLNTSVNPVKSTPTNK
jgi:hypothetical protein